MSLAWGNARRVYVAWTPVQRGFFWLAVGQLLLAALHAILWLVLGGTLEGPVSIRKPVLFGQSFALVSLTFAFVWNDLGLPRRSVAFLGWFSIALSGMEVLLAALQFWRGVPSHFNYATLFDGAVAGTMTAGALIFALFLLGLAALAWTRRPDTIPAERRSLAYSLRFTIVLTLFGLAAIGLVMLLNGGERWHGVAFLEASLHGFRLGRYNGQAPDLAGGGRLMLVHALGTHAFQVMPFAGWLAGRHGAPESRWRPRVRAVGAAYGLLMLLATLRALSA